MLTKRLAEDVRVMQPGETVSRVRMSTLAGYRDIDHEADRASFNAYVTKLRKETGYSLTTATLAPQVIGDRVARCYTVTRAGRGV